MNADVERLQQLEEFGSIMSESVVKFFKEEQNLAVIQKLKDAGVNTEAGEDKSEGIPQLFEGGSIMSESVVKFFKEEQNLAVIQKLKDAGVNTEAGEDKSEGIPQLFEGMKIVLTGTLPTLKRNQAKEIIELRGGKATSSVSKSCEQVYYICACWRGSWFKIN